MRHDAHPSLPTRSKRNDKPPYQLATKAEASSQEGTHLDPKLAHHSTQMGHILVSKWGEVLIMKRMGFMHPNMQPSSEDRRYFDAFFDRNLVGRDVKEMDELFPTTKTLAGRSSHRPLIAAT
jgi:hypothetical protein